MNKEKTKKFAEEKFGKMNEIEKGWNLIHPEYIIKALEELCVGKDVDLDKLKALAWVHDIGKIENDENHAVLSVGILEKEFELDDVDRDCIINHGSNGKPETEEGKIFQTADGISLFYPETLLFRFWAEGKEGISFENMKEKMKGYYEKYLEVYSDRPEAVKILKNKFKDFLKSNCY